VVVLSGGNVGDDILAQAVALYRASAAGIPDPSSPGIAAI
jgi:hypothetical protein